MEPGRISFRGGVLGLALGSALALAGAASAACKMPGDPPGPAVLAGYALHPKAILSEHPLADTGLTILAAQLATSGNDPLANLIGVLSDATDKQRTAIGAGLAAAANTCMKQDSGVVQRINDAVKKSGSAALKRSFLINYDIGPTNAASSQAGSSAKANAELPRDLTLPKLERSSKLPDPFGPPDGWR